MVHQRDIIRIHGILQLLHLIEKRHQGSLDPVFSTFLHKLSADSLCLGYLYLFTILKQRQGAPYHKTIHRNRIIRVTAKAGFQLRQPSLAVYRNLLLGGTGNGGGGLQVKV